MASDAIPETEPYAGDVLRVFGPPGTGKTTYLASRVGSTVQQYGSRSLLLASFSTTAAHEIASRFADTAAGARPDDDMVGTLHSHAYRSVGRSAVAVDPRVVKDWNQTCSPELHITPDTRKSGGSSGDSGALSVTPEQARTGDELLGALDRLRAALVPEEDWPANVREFEKRWSAWKRDVGAVDYTDMIEHAWHRGRDGEAAPSRPQFVVVDEAQDMTPLEIQLALVWGQHAGRLILGMDDDQAINQWRGGDPAPLLALHGEGVTDHVLDQSWRVPESVRAVAERWVRRLPLRREKVYRSRTDDSGQMVVGRAFHVPEKLDSPELVEELAAVADSGRTAMVIASCNYMLEPLINNLKSTGTPFHNPFRPGEQRWNPLGVAREGAIATVERVRRFLALTERPWTGADIQAWIDLVKLSDAGMVRGAKRVAAGFDPNRELAWHEIAGLFRDDEEGKEGLRLATEPDLAFLERALLKGMGDRVSYPMQLARTHGPAALDVQPQIVVGTIHSVKGAAADVVYLAPDISNAAAQNIGRSPGGAAEAIRLFYVGMTRAYQELRILTPTGPRHMKASELIPPTLEVIA